MAKLFKVLQECIVEPGIRPQQNKEEGAHILAMTHKIIRLNLLVGAIIAQQKPNV
jgi:hypothetical protein